VVAVAAVKAFAPEDAPHHIWLLAIVCSCLPDADVLGLYLGVPYDHFCGHRGFFHSLFFSFLLSIFIVAVFFGHLELFSRQWLCYLIFFFLVSASHGVLDAFTNGGLGIALLAPFDNARYFFPWTPISVSPIGIDSFFSQWGLTVMKSELLWIWLPSVSIVIISLLIRAVTVSP
jgi:inner membrane protein